ncbi:dihydroxyacetone kinase-like protein [Actinorugispora endophytica]|uniref:Dihydroxyacetone kinase-like protein n=2 Tax=Actinorugispora endophytica TaxID=1605990 RepID=A0A4R6UPP2_9ACTN|nr:dihydroxyacetone kinase-like protein [Actinorugispora endophytica]
MDSVTIDLARAWMRAAAESMDEHAEELTRLDAAIGDGDHGSNMRRGFSAVAGKLADTDFPSVGSVLTLSGRTLISTVGGASGPLYGTVLRSAGKRLTGSTASPGELLDALRDGMEAVRGLGGAQVRDKTMVDALAPALAAYSAALEDGADLGAAVGAAARAAGEGAQATVPMTARKGRASYLGERSRGHQDPGAASTALLFAALASVVGAPDVR